MNNALAVLLAEWVHHWDSRTDPDEKKLDIVEAKQHLQGLVRLVMDEAFVEAIAKRLHAAAFGGSWDEAPQFRKQQSRERANAAVDAFKDEIMEDREYTPEEQAEVDRLLDKADEIGRVRCSWCGHEIIAEATNTGDNLVWRLEDSTGVEYPGRCEMSPTRFHQPS